MIAPRIEAAIEVQTNIVIDSEIAVRPAWTTATQR
jgi:hypothetical protein